MKYHIDFYIKALKDIKKIEKSGDKQTLKKVKELINELEMHPREGTGKPERLKHYQEEIWSRMINKKDRLVYEIIEEEILIVVISSLGHYSDK